MAATGSASVPELALTQQWLHVPPPPILGKFSLWLGAGGKVVGEGAGPTARHPQGAPNPRRDPELKGLDSALSKANVALKHSDIPI